MSFISPGRLYVDRHGKSLTSYEDILAYAEFLQIEAGVSDNLPVDLDKIFKHFEIPDPKPIPVMATWLIRSNLHSKKHSASDNPVLSTIRPAMHRLLPNT